MLTLHAGTVMLLLVGILTGGGVISASAFSGQGTYYYVDVGPTACGQMYSNDEYIVALGYGIFDNYPGADRSNPNTNPICNLTLQATYQGKSVVATVVDRCASCFGEYDTDFSPAAFSALAPQSLGRIDLEWEWVTNTPVGPVVSNSNSPSSTEQRRSRTRSFGRRKPLDPAPAQPIRRASATQLVPSMSTEVTKPPKRRYLTEAERRSQAQAGR